MATTGFWPVKGSLKDVVKYAENPDKTTNPKYLDDDLAVALKYVANDDKTDKQLFVGAINCPPVRAYEQMMATKCRYGKTGGNVAYHGYQSFKSGEVTHEEAFEIGMKTARRMWGKDYEIVVTTHLNTDNIHNHIVINSVSFKTGLKFENHISDHIKLREISDAVCKEYGRSVLENAEFYNGDRNAYWVHKRGGKTYRDILREDVDSAIKQAGNLLEFERIMCNFGYTFNRNIMTEHPSVITKGWKRAVRIDSLGKDYARERIIRRIADNKIFVSSFGKSERVQRTKPKHTPLMELEYQLRRVKYMDTVEALFYLLLELLKSSTPKPNYTPPLSPVLRQELRKFEQYQKQFRLLHDEQIGTVPELEAFIGKLSMQISELEEERSKTDNKHRRRNTVTGRTSLFSGLAYCADCGSKLYFCASKSIDKDAEFFRCSQYKDNRGKCTIHFIRNVVLEELVLTAIRNVAEYISQFEPVFLYLFAKQHKLSKQHNLKMAKQNLEHSKMRIAEIDRVLTKLYEDNALGKITDERFERLSATYELEQKELYEAISKAEQDIENAEQENVDLKVFLQTIRQCTDLKELAPTIVNTLIKRIDVHNPDEKFKHRRVKIDIYFTAVGLISIPDEKELLALMDEIRNEKSA